MILDQITHFHVWHCGNLNHNKVWGWFSHGALIWAFWGGIGKAYSFKLHGATSWVLDGELLRLEGEKVKKGYAPICKDDLDVLNPT